MNTQSVNATTTETAPVQEKVQRVNPLVDVYENQDGLKLLVDFPGVSPSDVSVQFERNELKIEGPFSIESRRFLYSRRFVIPFPIDVEKIAARLADGVLTIELPRVAAAKPRTILVNVES